jgi:hypothetical protein
VQALTIARVAQLLEHVHNLCEILLCQLTLSWQRLVEWQQEFPAWRSDLIVGFSPVKVHFLGVHRGNVLQISSCGCQLRHVFVSKFWLGWRFLSCSLIFSSRNQLLLYFLMCNLFWTELRLWIAVVCLCRLICSCIAHVLGHSKVCIADIELLLNIVLQQDSRVGSVKH